MIVLIIVAVIMVLIATICVLYRTWVVKPELPGASSTPQPTVSGTLVSESEEPDLPDYDPVQPKVSGERKSEDIYTILVFGADEASGLTDTMMLVTYDITNQSATVVSFPRDTIINSSARNIASKKLNAVYARSGGGEAGINALKEEVSELVGFAPDYYVMINWDLVGLMVDAIGGVYFDVPNDMKYSDPYQDLYIDLDEGYQLLNGDQAMQLVRWRKNNDGSGIATNGDIGRLDIQHNFLKEVLKQTLQLKNATKISELAKLFGENVVSDLTVENLFWFGSQAIFSGLNVDNVQFVTMPFYYGTYPYWDGSNWQMSSFVYPIQNSMLTLINSLLNPYVDEVTLRELDLIYVNSEGGLSSTTGVLANASYATLPEDYLAYLEAQKNPPATDDPDPSADPEDPEDPEDPDMTGDDEWDDPDASDDPDLWFDPEPETSGEPGGDDPYPSDDPVESDDSGDSGEEDYFEPFPEYSEDPGEDENDPTFDERNSGEMPG